MVVGLVAESCPTLVTPWTVAHQAPLSMAFPRKNTGVSCHFLLQGSSQPGDGTTSPAQQADSLLLSPEYETENRKIRIGG